MLFRSPIKSCLINWVSHYAKFNQEAFEMGKAALKERSTELVHMACRLFAYAQRQEMTDELQKLSNSKNAKIRTDISFALKALQLKNHLEFTPGRQWHAFSSDNYISQRPEEQWLEDVNYYIVKQLKENELKTLTTIVKDIYKR